MNLKKKIISLLLAFAMVMSLSACGNKTEKKDEKPAETPATESKDTKKDEKKDDAKPGEAKKIGVIIYNGGDPYIQTVKQALEVLDAADDSYELDIQDGQNNQGTQNDQIDALIAKKVDALLINVVDFGAGSQLKEKVKKAGIPTVFWNRDISKDLTKEDLESVIFFGTNAPQAGVFQGEMARDLWKSNKALDRNGDGKVQYVMLHGGLDNQEAVARTTESVKALTDAGIQVEELGMQVAEWDQDKAKTAMDAWLGKDGDKIELVFANNDNMAFGAVQALKSAGYNKGEGSTTIPVYGVDALKDALVKVENGEMAGTVRQSNETMAKGIISLIKNKLEGKDWVEGTEYKIFDGDGVSVRMDYEKVTK